MLDGSAAPAPAPTPVTASLAAIRWIGFQTIVIREYGRIIRIWGQTLVPAIVTEVPPAWEPVFGVRPVTVGATAAV